MLAVLVAAAVVGLGGLGCVQLAGGHAIGAAYVLVALLLLLAWWPSPPVAIP